MHSVMMRKDSTTSHKKSLVLASCMTLPFRTGLDARDLRHQVAIHRA
jgi:hypothetical protein